MNVKNKLKEILRPLYRRYLAIRNRGDNVTCNICGKSYRRLRPIIGRHSDGTPYLIKDRVGSCWLCNSYPRTRQLFHWLHTDFDIAHRGKLKILHIAPEQQISDKLRAYPDLEYTCIDKHCYGYDYPDYVLDGDVCNLRFDDGSFDLIICNHVLEHILDDRKALSEINRVLKHNGVAILMVPIDIELQNTIEESESDHFSPAEREQRFGQFDHVRLYGSDYFERLNDAGFEIRRVKYNDSIVSRYGLQPDEEVIVCFKN